MEICFFSNFLFFKDYFKIVMNIRVAISVGNTLKYDIDLFVIRGILKKRPPSQVESDEPVVPPISVRNVSKGYEMH